MIAILDPPRGSSNGAGVDGGGRGEGVGVQNPEGSVVVKKNRLSLKKKKIQ